MAPEASAAIPTTREWAFARVAASGPPVEPFTSRAAVDVIAARTPGSRVESAVAPDSSASGRDAGPNQPSQTPTSRSPGWMRGSANCSLAPTEIASPSSKRRTCLAPRTLTRRPSAKAYAGAASIPAADARVPPLNWPAASPPTK